MAPQPELLLAIAGAVALEQRPEPRGVIEVGQVAGLVPDDVVENVLGREQQAPVEAHRARRRARAPAGALVADAHAGVLDADRLTRLVEPGYHLGAGHAAIPALDRGARVAGRDVQDVAAPVGAGAAGLGGQAQGLAEERDGGAALGELGP